MELAVMVSKTSYEYAKSLIIPDHIHIRFFFFFVEKNEILIHALFLHLKLRVTSIIKEHITYIPHAYPYILSHMHSSFDFTVRI